MTPALRGDNALPFAVPARFLLTGALALAAAWTALALKPQLALGYYGSSGALAVVHAFTLGFATLILVGAMHQLVPVLLVTKLHAPCLGALTYGLLATGALGVVLGFASGYRPWLLALGGTGELAGLALFDYNLWRTARQANKRDAVSAAMLLSALCLTLTVGLGLTIALGRVFPDLGRQLGYLTPLHLSLGLFGAFFVAIAGAGHKLLAMFVLTHGLGQWRLKLLLGCVASALAVLALHAVTGTRLWWVALALLAAAVLLFGLDVRAIVAKRLRRGLELPLRTYLLAPLFLALAALFGLLGHYPAAVFAVLGGFVTLAVAGMLVKIVSFLAWQHRYAAKIGRAPVPMMRDMTYAPLARSSAWGLALGALGLTAALVWPWLPLAAGAGALGTIGAWSLVAHLVVIAAAKHAPRAASPAQPAKGPP